MSIIRVNKNKNYTTMSNYHLQEKDMSLKAKGLLSQMLSLPENWDYSIIGLTQINKEGIDTIRNVLKELEVFGYLKRTKIKDEKGQFIDVEYNIYEIPNRDGKNPLLENPITDNPILEKPIQLNTKEINKLNNKILKKEKKKERKFIPPTLEDVREYCKKRKNKIDADFFFNYYNDNNWIDNKGEEVRNWKGRILTWEKKDKDKNKNKNKEELPEWFNNVPKSITKDDEKEMEQILSSFN